MGGSGYSNVARGGDKEAGFEFHDGGVDSLVSIFSAGGEMKMKSWLGIKSITAVCLG